MSVYGCTFKGLHSYHDLGLIMRSVDRNLRTAIKRHQVDIPFLDGKIDTQGDEDEVYDNKPINISFTYNHSSLEELRRKDREVAQWLSGRGKLLFDDEPGVYYDAKVYNVIPLDQSRLGRMMFNVEFECYPFALGPLQSIPHVITVQGQQLTVNVDGNRRTGGVITLTNVGSSTINRFKIVRERRKS